MLKLTIACALTLVATLVNAQDSKAQQTRTPVSADETRPFLFDGRMIGDGKRQNAPVDRRRSNSGAIVVSPSDKKAD